MLHVALMCMWIRHTTLQFIARAFPMTTAAHMPNTAHAPHSEWHPDFSWLGLEITGCFALPQLPCPDKCSWVPASVLRATHAPFFPAGKGEAAWQLHSPSVRGPCFCVDFTVRKSHSKKPHTLMIAVRKLSCKSSDPEHVHAMLFGMMRLGHVRRCPRCLALTPGAPDGGLPSEAGPSLIQRYILHSVRARVPRRLAHVHLVRQPFSAPAHQRSTPAPVLLQCALFAPFAVLRTVHAPSGAV